MGCPYAAAEATKAAASEATEAATTASRRIARTPTHGCEPTREAAMAILCASTAAFVQPHNLTEP